MKYVYILENEYLEPGFSSASSNIYEAFENKKDAYLRVLELIDEFKSDRYFPLKYGEYEIKIDPYMDSIKMEPIKLSADDINNIKRKIPKWYHNFNIKKLELH